MPRSHGYFSARESADGSFVHSGPKRGEGYQYMAPDGTFYQRNWVECPGWRLSESRRGWWAESDGIYMDRAPLAGKDPALGELVDRLAADLGSDSFVLMDHWEDLMAIGLARPSQHDVLIYVSVKVDDEGEALTSENRYFYECETPDESDDYGYVASGRGDHVAYEEVRKAVTQHLRLS